MSGSIVAYRWYETEIDDQREITENKIRNKIMVKTSTRMPWSQLRLIRPIPQWNDEHPNEPGFYLDFVKPVHKSRLIWELEAEYTPFKQKKPEPNPVDRPAQITFDVTLVEQPTFLDRKGRPMCNTAGELFEGITRKIPIIEYSIKKNVKSDPGWLWTHLGGINDEPIEIRGLRWGKKTLLLASVAAGPIVEEEKTKYVEYTLKVIGDPRGFETKLWNRGTVELVQIEQTDAKGQKKKVLVQKPIKSGDPPEFVDEPVPLDENGKAILDYLQRDEKEPIKKSAVIMRTFEVQDEVDFKKLPLE